LASQLVPDKQFIHVDNVKQYLVARLNESTEGQLFANDLKLANEFIVGTLDPNKQTAIEQINNRTKLTKDIEIAQKKL